jgi:hypothetical protein
LNIGEKRKRKLQYLQQLVKDDSNDEKTPEPSPQLHQTQIRSCSREFDVGPSSSPFMPPSSSDIVSISSSNASALSPIPVASTITYDSHHITARQTCSPFEMSWSNTIYDPRLANTYTPGWAPSIAYHPQVAPRQGDYTSSAPAAHTVFGQTTSPYLHPRDLPPNADHFYLGMFNGPYNGSQSQTYSIPSVSLPTSPYFQGYYPGSH